LIDFWGEKMSQILYRLRRVGPALVLAAVVIGPGSITLSTIAGSLYGYRLLWVLVCSTVFMIVYTQMAARIGLVTGQTLFDLTRRRYGRTTARIGGLFGFLSIVAFQAGNSAAVGFCGNALFGGDARVWSILFFLAAFGLLFLPHLYRKIEFMVKTVVGLMLAAFVGTLLTVGVSIEGLAAGLIPSFPDNEAVFLSLGMAATTFSIAAASYQSYLMREKNWGAKDLAVEMVDTVIGIALLGTISVVILLTSSNVLHGSGVTVFSAQAMAQQLEPLAGPAAFILFTAGFFFAGFSSLVINPFIGSTLLVDGFGGDSSMDGKAVKSWAGVILCAGVTVVLLFQGTPIELLRIAQSMAVVAFPILGFLVWSIARNRSIMKDQANSKWLDIPALLGFLTILGIVLNYLRQVLS